MIIRFVGDVHGHHQAFAKIAADAKFNGEKVVQVGDMGLGFGHDMKYRNPPDFGDGVYFIRGNHDNPQFCRKSPNYLGDFGFSKELNLFFVSGAWSIDQHLRTIGWDWWQDEQLSMPQCSEVLTLWDKVKPNYVITHDAPTRATHSALVVDLRHPGRVLNQIPTRMGQLFDQMFEYHQPAIWIFGHYHVPIDEVIDGTRFICLPELASMAVQIPSIHT